MIRLALLLCLAWPAHAETLKISTWNLNWLTSRSRAEARLPADVHTRAPEDFARLAVYARKLAADIVAFQEVDGSDAAARVFDPQRYTILTIDEPVTQRVGLAVRRDLPVHRNPDVSALDVEPHALFPLRDGLDATVDLPGGSSVRILVVHLKTGCQTDPLAGSTRAQCALLRRQVAPLAAWASDRAREHVPFLLLGDFNRVLDLPEELGDALGRAAPLTRATEGFANPCWDGDAFIDHIFLGGPARSWLVPASLRVQLFRESGDQWRARLSDHCPVSVKLLP